MAKKVAAVVLLILALAPQGFSKARWYAKATMGGGYLNVGEAMLYSYSYSNRFGNYSGSYYEDVDNAIFAVKPAGGIEWRKVKDDGTPGIVGFSLEASVGLAFGETSGLVSTSMIAVTPGIMGIVSFESRFHLWRFVPYLGVGVSVPMVFFGEGSREYSYSSSYESYSIADFAYSLLDANFLLGFGVAITENIMPVLEAQCNYGFGVPNSMLDFEVRLGCVYKFGK